MLAAYRVGDSPINAITPLNAYFALIVTFAQKYQKDAGVGTVVALMLPYVLVLMVAGRSSWRRGTCWGFHGGCEPLGAMIPASQHRA